MFTGKRNRGSKAALQLTLALAACGGCARLVAQAPHTLTAEEQQKVDSLVQRMTSEQKLDYIGGTGFAVRAMPLLGLPALEMSDGPYGTRSNKGLPSTTYAAGIGLAASWDRDLAMQVGAAIGRDARARGVHFMLGPGVNIYRSPRNGRNFEYFGEDPFLAGEMAVGYITGMQQQGVSATVKHFLANNSEYLRHDSDSIVDERTLREIYLPAFEAAVKRGHVGAIMDSYNLINGTHATQNSYFNTEIARKEWKFPGIMMSDWDATYDGVGAANGGLDLEMPTGKFMNRKTLMPALQSGAVRQATIDEKVQRIISTAQSFGWLDTGHLQRDTSLSLLNGENNRIALRSARESIVLLKNNGNLLPLDRHSMKTVLVVGPVAYPGVAVGGGSAGVVPFHMIGPLEGVSNLLADDQVNVMYDQGVPTLADLAHGTKFMTAAKGGKPGVTVETFPNDMLSGAGTQGTTRAINTAGMGWDTISENLDELMESFLNEKPKASSHRITGYYNAEKAGPYLIAMAAAGEGNGERLYLDGKLVIDNWDLTRAFEPHLTMPLSAGMHKVVVESKQKGPIGGKLRVAILPEEQAVNTRAKELAAKADVVIVAAGYQSNKDNESEGEGGDRTFDLPYGQDALIQAMAAANPRTIVSLTSGGNVDSRAWIDQVPALLENWYGGQAGGRALAEVLFGEVNPGGHLPATFERNEQDNPTYKNYYPAEGTKKVFYKEGIFVGYRGYQHDKVKPLFPFGFGLSYTTFAFKNLAVTSTTAADMQVTFDVTNTGNRKGADVAQVYVGDPHTKVPRPIREMKGFERVELEAGKTKHVTVPLDARSFAYYDVARKQWAIDPGHFTVEVGDSVESLPLKETVTVSKETAAAAF